MNRLRMRHFPTKKPQKQIVIVDAVVPPENFANEDEYRLFIWSFMEPPMVSKPTPIISAERYGKIFKASIYVISLC